MASPGRNEPCPCGSRRKFKHCCLRAQNEEDSQRMQLRSAEGVLVPALFSYTTERFGKEFGTTFDPFFVFAFSPLRHCTASSSNRRA